MASFATIFTVVTFITGLASGVSGQLSSNFYAITCPSLPLIVTANMANAILKEPRMGASILRLFFHDCFVNGCDASVLLDDTDTFTGEKNAFPNFNSLRGYEVIDTIKSAVEAVCSQTVSCSDILALAARAGVVSLGGPSWTLQLGRRDARTASQNDANVQLPPPFVDLPVLASFFAAKGFNATEMTALSGSHTIGMARCINYRPHIYNDPNVDPTFAAQLKQNCTGTVGDPTDNNVAPMDATSPTFFDNSYYTELVAKRGLLHSDQELHNNGSQDATVVFYSQNGWAFRNDFAAAMAKMANLGLLTGTNGEIRKNCRIVN